MSKITVTTIAGQTSGADANKVKIESGDTLQVDSNATVGGTLGVTGTSVLTGNVGIGTSASTGNNPLVVQAGSGAGGINLHGRSSDNTATMLIGKSADGNTAYNTITSYANRMRIQSGFSSDTNTMEFFTNDVSRVVIDASGRVTMSGQPSFLANLASNPAMDVGVIPFTTVVHNVGSHYNAANYRFTAPVTGRYFLSYSMRANHGTSGHIIHPSFHINGSSDTASRTIYKNDTSAQYMGVTFSYIRQLSASDYVTVSTSGGSSGGTLQSGQCIFSGHLIG